VRVETKGSVEWLTTLKLYWDVKKTELRESEDSFAVLSMKKNVNVYVGYYDRESRRGVIYSEGNVL
jgi:hypothetical protein